MRRAIVVLAGTLAVVAGVLAGAGPAWAGAGWWHLDSTAAPTNLPIDGEAQVVVTAVNAGDTSIDARVVPVVLSDVLPEGLTPEGNVEVAAPWAKESSPPSCETLHVLPGRVTVRCELKAVLPPFASILARIRAHTQETPETLAAGLVNRVSIQGGGSTPATLERQLRVSEAPTSFGLQPGGYEVTPENEGGVPDTQAGSHPYQLTTTLDFNQVLAPYSGFSENGVFPTAPALPRDLHFRWPAGLIGDIHAVPQCSDADFSAAPGNLIDLCPENTVVGVATVAINDPVPLGYTFVTVPVFNLEPAPGEPARLGLDVANVPVVLRTAVPAGKEYGVEVTLEEASEAVQVLSSIVTVWGTPWDPTHDTARGWDCLGEGLLVPEPHCVLLQQASPPAFLTLPTSCEGTPVSTMGGDSWEAGPGTPSRQLTGEFVFAAPFDGCGSLAFEPTLRVAAEEHQASTPTGLDVSVRVPQEGLTAEAGRAQSAVRDATVTLPEGVVVSPSAANGLQACSEAEVGYLGQNPESQVQEFTPGEPSCPEASKLGSVEVETPILPSALTGSVYLAAPAPNGEGGMNPFGSLVAVYVVAEDPQLGILVKLAGEGRLDEQTGRVTTTFLDTPQVPFEELRLHLFGGPRASLSTPAFCGSYSTSASLTPWSSGIPVGVASPPGEFQVVSGANGAGCPGAELPFQPTLRAGASTSQAAAFTSFGLELGRPGGDQALRGVTVHLPPGVSGMLSNVTQCSEAQATVDQCPTSSEIGQATGVAGLGSEPFTQSGGRVFITGPYHGAPFGLEIVTPAVAGPFNLGTVTVRSRLYVNPETAALTVISDPLPTQLQGIPLQLGRVIVSIDRPSFQFNPTNCTPMSITGSIAGAGSFNGAPGNTAPASWPFQASNCATLPFNPVLTARTAGTASKLNGTSLDVKVTSPGLGQANIAKVALQLPAALPSRLTTIQKACPDSIFNTNPAGCDEGSLVGKATVHTPVLNSPLTGPAYLVSHGGAAFPDIEFVLQGEGITLILDGKTDIKGGITYTRFEAAPDAPFTSFETELPAGPHSALAAYVGGKTPYDLCNTTLTMPTTITAQNGAHTTQQTKITPTGCGAVKAYKTTRQQQLTKALTTCHKKYKHHHTQLQHCERQARKRYTTNKPTKHRH